MFAGLARLLDALDSFCFGPDELDWLDRTGVVSPAALEWLAGFSFAGDVHAYAEGELYTDGSPVLSVEAPFGQAVLLETIVLSILNHDSAVAAAASLIASAAGDRPVIEMGSRRTDAGRRRRRGAAPPTSADSTSTSNLEAGRRYGVPTAGTVAHAFILSFRDERAAFAAQAEAFGPDTTFLVDTYDMEEGIRGRWPRPVLVWRPSGWIPGTWAPWRAPGPGAARRAACGHDQGDRDRRPRRPDHPGAGGGAGRRLRRRNRRGDRPWAVRRPA